MLLALYAALATATATVSQPMTPDISTSVRFAGDRHALVSVFPGPNAEGDTSQGLEAAPWAVWQGLDKKLRLAKLGTQSNSSGEVFGLENWTTKLDRISLAFDQNGRRVVALSQAGTVALSRVLPGPVENRVNWAGVDCLLWFDGLLKDVAGGEPTDVIAFYLPLTRDSIKYRIQSENYSIERTYTALTQPSSLDALAMSQNRLVLYPTAQDSTTSNVVSNPYPYRLGETMSANVGLVAGGDVAVVASIDPASESLTLTAGLVEGLDYSPVASPDVTLELVAVSANLILGLDVLVVTEPDSSLDLITVVAGLNAGSIVQTVFDSDPNNEIMTVTAGLIGGSIT